MGWKERLNKVKKELQTAQTELTEATPKQRLDACCKAVSTIINVMIRVVDALP